MPLINQSRKTLLLIKRCPALKKMVASILIGSQCNALMRWRSGRCELVGIFILYKLKNVFQNNTFGLHRVDELAVIKDLSGSKIETLDENVVETFKDWTINIAIKDNLQSAILM